MRYTYAHQKKPGGAGPAYTHTQAASAGEKEPAVPNSARLAALQSGTAKPSAEELGQRVDLPEAVRSKMESSFGADLSAVKLYQSQAVADAGAEAVTSGSSIAFAPGKLDFVSSGGQALLGHELSHVVSQARGEVRGSGFLDNPALEARADREGAMAAAGKQVYTGSVTAALSPAAPSPATVGAMQAKKDNAEEQPAPENEAAAAPGELDFAQMNFGNKAYRKDAEYQAISTLMTQYGSIDETTDRRGKNQAKIQLMNSAMNYIEKYSGGKKAKHKGRTANLEKLLYDLSMKGGTAGRADANLQKLQNASDASDADDRFKEGARNTFDHLKGVYGAGSQYSPTMQMITAGVLADQNASGASGPIYTPTETRSAAGAIFAPGSPGYSGDHQYTISSRTGGSLNDSIGTTLHELTHVASGEDYQNAGLMNIGADATDEEIKERAMERIQSSEGILDALGTAKIKNLNPEDASFKMFATNKLSYQVENKLPQYDMADRRSNLRDFLGRALEGRGKGEQQDKLLSYANLDMLKYMVGEQDKPNSYTGASGETMEQIKSSLTDDEKTDLNRIREFDKKQHHVVDLLGGNPNDPKEREKTEKKKKSITKLLNANKVMERKPQKSYTDFEANGSNSLVEHDSVMNQMLLQYENAGQSSGNVDRDSLFYRRLRNAALKAHVQRQIAKLQR